MKENNRKERVENLGNLLFEDQPNKRGSASSGRYVSKGFLTGFPLIVLESIYGFTVFDHVWRMASPRALHSSFCLPLPLLQHGKVSSYLPSHRSFMTPIWLLHEDSNIIFSLFSCKR
jgi:hypothetical protein